MNKWRAQYPFMSITGSDLGLIELGYDARHRFWVYCDICETTLGDAVQHDQAIEKAISHGNQHNK